MKLNFRFEVPCRRIGAVADGHSGQNGKEIELISDHNEPKRETGQSKSR